MGMQVWPLYETETEISGDSAPLTSQKGQTGYYYVISLLRMMIIWLCGPFKI